MYYELSICMCPILKRRYVPTIRKRVCFVCVCKNVLLIAKVNEIHQRLNERMLHESMFRWWAEHIQFQSNLHLSTRLHVYIQSLWISHSCLWLNVVRIRCTGVCIQILMTLWIHEFKSYEEKQNQNKEKRTKYLTCTRDSVKPIRMAISSLIKISG